MKKIIVLMATYNGSQYIDEQIKSILNQNDVLVDLLISDDGSSDDTVKIIQNYLSDNRVSLIQNIPASGSAANNFLSLIKSLENFDNYDAFAFSDQDDIWLTDKLTCATKYLDKNNAQLYVSDVISWNQSTDKKALIKKSFKQKKFDFLFEGGSAGCTYVFTKEFYVFVRNNIMTLEYKDWINFSHDWYLYFIARANNYKVYIDSNSYILYRIHDKNVHGHLNSSSYSSFKKRLDMVRDGWYIKQIARFKHCVPSNSIEYRIYELYTKSLLTRVYVLIIYNFKLMRSPFKFLMFAFVSLFPQKT